MQHRAIWSTVLLAGLAAVLSATCGGEGETAPSRSPNLTCLPVDDGSSTCWEQVRPLGSGGFPPEKGNNDSPKWEPGRWPLTLQPVIGFNDDLWMMSQTNSWSSSDGLNWTHYQKADWGERISQEYAFFNNRLWMFGGLRYADRTPLNDVWSSADGVTWEQMGNAGWSPRKAHTIVVFRDKLWLFGGADRVGQDFSTEHSLNDVWSSDDGQRWTQVAATAPWPAREGAKVVVLNDQLFMLGGDGLADVWSSPDGVNWTQLSAEAEWKPRFGYAASMFGDKLWVYAGWPEKPTDALNDLWYSADGKTWTQQTKHAPWSPRSPRTIVYKDRLWIFSGKHTGAKDSWGGDIWTMSAAQ